MINKLGMPKWGLSMTEGKLLDWLAQRLMIARALVHRPRILFLDEPTSGIDPQTRVNLWDVLRSLHAEGQTILLTTHYMEEADALCQRVAVMDHGRLLADGSPAELKRSSGPTRSSRSSSTGTRGRSPTRPSGWEAWRRSNARARRSACSRARATGCWGR